jgi:hypothetical protein
MQCKVPPTWPTFGKTLRKAKVFILSGGRLRQLATSGRPPTHADAEMARQAPGQKEGVEASAVEGTVVLESGRGEGMGSGVTGSRSRDLTRRNAGPTPGAGRSHCGSSDPGPAAAGEEEAEHFPIARPPDASASETACQIDFLSLLTVRLGEKCPAAMIDGTDGRAPPCAFPGDRRLRRRARRPSAASWRSAGSAATMMTS